MKINFHTTASERRIISELLAIAALRSLEPPPAVETETAERYITRLEQQLFPETSALRQKRVALLASLQSDFLTAHSDRNLETGSIGLRATISNAAQYEVFKEKINAFDYQHWFEHCEQERTHAD